MSNTSKKYELLETDKMLPNGKPAFQVRRLSDGMLGGYVEGEHNLSQYKACFIYDKAQVYGNAYVSGNARVQGNARVSDNAQLYSNVRIYGNAHIYGNAQVGDSAQVYDDALVYGSAQVYSNACVFDDAHIYGNVCVYGGAQVYSTAQVTKCLYVQQPKYNITATDTHVFIGCEGHTWQYWSRNITRIGKKYKYTTREINQVKALLKILKSQIRSM